MKVMEYACVRRRSFTLPGVLLLLLLVVTARPVRGQEKDAPPVGAWTVNTVGKFSFTQAAYSNWREGGVNTLAFTGTVDADAKRRTGAWQQVHEARVMYGVVRHDTLNFRKREDMLRLASRFEFQGEGFFNRFSPTLAARLRTQFAPGYNYDKVPPVLQKQFADTLTTPVKVSSFFSPAVWTQSVGLTYNPDSWISQRVGMGLKQTVVIIERLRPLNYGKDSDQLDQPLRFEAGVESHTKVDREIFENVRLQSALGLFYAYNQLEEPPDALWENTLTLGVNDWLSVDLEGSMLYDENIDDRPQMKEVLSIGISYALI